MSVRRDEDRLANLAPRRDAGPVSEADVWQGTPQKADNERIRKAERERLAGFWHRRYGRAIAESDYPENLREGGAA
jgi:hypothetical protein